jgi:hypothetical protein
VLAGLVAGLHRVRTGGRSSSAARVF